jgi:mannose-1-phosphate guanylyltransferase
MVMTMPPCAFVLGAGLGTRLRPLTEFLPKPLVPVANRPLVTYALEHLSAELGVVEVMINTHHCPEAYERAFPRGCYRDQSLSFRHEPILLDTAGGIDNIRDWLPTNESFVVYNGDILTDLPLRAAWQDHLRSGALVTMVLRSSGPELRVGFEAASGAVVDLRGLLRPEWQERYQFTGIYFVAPRFLDYVRPGEIESVVPRFIAAIQAGEMIRGFVADEGHWSDLGDRESYLDALVLGERGFPSYLGATPWRRFAEGVELPKDLQIDAYSTIGEGVSLGKGVCLEKSVLWPGAAVGDGASLRRVVVCEGRRVEGVLEQSDR